MRGESDSRRFCRQRVATCRESDSFATDRSVRVNRIANRFSRVASLGALYSPFYYLFAKRYCHPFARAHSLPLDLTFSIPLAIDIDRIQRSALAFQRSLTQMTNCPKNRRPSATSIAKFPLTWKIVQCLLLSREMCLSHGGFSARIDIVESRNEAGRPRGTPCIPLLPEEVISSLFLRPLYSPNRVNSDALARDR